MEPSPLALAWHRRYADADASWRRAVGLTRLVLVCTGVLLWFWWPVLVGRQRPRLADGPQCATCGYNLTGNTSGRCPECGEDATA